MFTIRHTQENGSQTVTAAVRISYDPVLDALIGHGVPGTSEPVTFSDGRAYIMNDNGRTVAIYDGLGKKTKKNKEQS